MKQHDRDNSPQFPDRATRQFLLGSLGPAEQMMFEERLFADQALETRVRLAEYELADQYVFDRLSAADRELFEEKFLVSADRKKKLRVSRALGDRYARSWAPSAEKATVGQRLQLLFGFSQPAWRLAIGVVILAIFVGIVWLVMKEPHINKRLTFKPQRATSVPTPEAEHRLRGSSEPTHEGTPLRMPDHEPTVSPLHAPKTNSTREAELAPAGVSIVLFPGNPGSSGEMPRVSLPQRDRDIVRVQLTLERNEPGTYRAELLTGRQSVFSTQSLKLKDTGPAIDFDVPARLLKEGDYQVRLSRVIDGSEGAIARYYFRVR